METPSSSSGGRHSDDDILLRLASPDSAIKVKAVREVKNNIIGNHTKKLSYIRLGAVPAIMALIADENADPYLLLQCTVVIGSFACGFDDGVCAVVKAGAIEHLNRLLTSSDTKKLVHVKNL